MESRDPERHETILSADLNDNDDPSHFYSGMYREDNAYHVFYHPKALALDHTAVLDGVTITGGNASQVGTGINASGGGMLNVEASPTIRNVRFHHNSAFYMGGAIVNTTNSHPHYFNVTIHYNRAGQFGGGIYNNNNSHPVLESVTIEGNSAMDSNGNGQAGGIGNYNSSPTLINVDIRYNYANYSGGGMENLSGAPILNNVTIYRNEANAAGGGMLNYGSHPELMNVVIRGNLSRESGGGMYNLSSKPKLVNTQITVNAAPQFGGGMYNEGTHNEVTMTHVTISGNSTSGEGGGIYSIDAGKIVLRNSIVWGNDTYSSGESNIWSVNSASADIDASMVGLPDIHVPDGVHIDEISLESLFIDAKSYIQIGPSFEGNFRLQRTSPAIGRGDLAYVPAGLAEDLDGFARVTGDSVDLGAYEYQGLWQWPVDSKITVQEATLSSLDIVWSAAASLPSFVGYNIYVNDEQIQTQTNEQLTLTGLEHSTVYNLKVRPFDRYGYESEALEADVVTVLAKPSAHPNPADGALQAGSEVTLSASPGASIYYTTDGTEPSIASHLYTGPIQLLQSTTIKAVSQKTGFASSEILTVSYDVYPAPPLNVIGVADDRKVALQWTAAPASVTYAVYQHIGSVPAVDLADWKLVQENIIDTKYTVVDLQYDTVYSFAVKAFNDQGESGWSNVFEIVLTDQVRPEWPAENRELRVTDLTESSFKVIWRAATDNVAVTQYKVNLDGNEYEKVASSVNELEVTGLQKNTRYTIDVIPVDAAGNEGDSLSIQVTTLQPKEEEEPGKDPGDDPGKDPDEEPDDDPGKDPGEDDPGKEPSDPGEGPGEEPGDDDPGEKPSDPGEGPGDEPGDDPGKDPGEKPDDKPDDKPIIEPVAGRPQLERRPEPQLEHDQQSPEEDAGESESDESREEASEDTPMAEQPAPETPTEGDGAADHVPSQPNEIEVVLTDIDDHWAVQSIMQAVRAGIVQGFPDGTFKPDQPITRAEFAVMLVGALSLEGEGAELTFEDVDEIGEWARHSIALAVEAKLFVGYADNHFRPNQPITRAEIAVITSSLLNLDIAAYDETLFADNAQIPSWAKGAIEALRSNGLVTGRGGGRYAPNDTTTRAEAVVFLLRALSRM